MKKFFTFILVCIFFCTFSILNAQDAPKKNQNSPKTEKKSDQKTDQKKPLKENILNPVKKIEQDNTKFSFKQNNGFNNNMSNPQNPDLNVNSFKVPYNDATYHKPNYIYAGEYKDFSKSKVPLNNIEQSKLIKSNNNGINMSPNATTLINPAGDGGFETGTTFAANGWTVSNSANNPWVIGTYVSTPPFANRSAYASNDGGLTNNYTNTNSCVNYFYRDITVPAGESIITLTFNWVCNGESTWDMWQVFTSPTSIVPTATTTYPGSGTSTIPSGITGATFINYGNLQTTIQTATLTLPASLAGTTFRLILAWKDDTSGGTAPAASIDNISLVSRTPIPPDAPPISFTASAVTQTSMTIGWTDNSTNETAFRVYRSTDNITFTQQGTDIASTSTGTTGTLYSQAQTSLIPGTTYYYRIVSVLDLESSYLLGNQATLAAGTITSIASGNWSVPATWSTGVVPTATDNVTIANTHTVIIDAAANCLNLTVGQGTSGILRYGTVAVTLTVNGSITIAAGGTFDAGAAAGASLVHSLYVGGNSGSSPYIGSITSNGTFNMCIGASNGRTTITFFGNQNSFIAGTGTINFNNTNIINKGTTTATSTVIPPILDIQRGFTIQGANTLGIIATHTAGTLKISGTFTQSSIIYTSTAYAIPALGGIWINNANFTVTGQNGTPSCTGLLRVTSGTYNIGTASGNSLTSGVNSVYIIEGGAINVAGRFNLTSTGVYYNQSGGTLSVSTVGNTSSATASFGITSATGTSFIMSGGTIVLVQRTTGATIRDYYNVALNLNVTGGTLQIGSAATATNFNFRLYGYTPSININNTTNSKKAEVYQVASSVVYIFGTLTVNTGTTFDCLGMSAFSLGNVVNNGIIQGLVAGSRFDFMNTSSQTYSGTGTFGTLAAPFIGTGVGIANTNNVTLSAPIVTTRVNLFTGTFINSNQITLGNAGTSSVFIQRGGASTGAAGSFDVLPVNSVGTGGYTVSYYSTTSMPMVTTGNEIPSSRTINGFTVNTTNGVTLNDGALSTAAYTMTLGNLTTDNTNLITVIGTATTAITRTAGYVNGPIARTLPASLVTGSTYLLPVGKGTYNPFELVNPTTGAGGTVVVQAEVFDANCGGTPGSGMGSLNTNRYWNATITSGVLNFLSTTARLTESSAIPAGTGIGQSLTQTGSYNLVSSAAPSGTTLITDAISSLNYFVIGNKSVPMAYTSSTTTQNTNSVGIGTTNQQIIGIQIVTTGNASPLNATTLTVNANGTTNTADISNAKIFYTGTSNIFSAINQFGSTVPSPTTINFDVTGSQTLSEGTNYFWLTFDIPSSATNGNLADAECTSITVGGTPYVPSVTAPAGSRTIILMYDFEAATDEGWTHSAIAGSDEWARGVPTGGTNYPTSTHSPTKCWGTNLTGNYSNNVDYSLYSPIFTASGTTAGISWWEWYYTESCCDHLYAQYSLNGGAWTDLVATYTGGPSVSWTQRNYSIVTTAGNQVQFRWRLTSDVSISYCGWYVDDAGFTGLFIPSTPVFSITPTSKAFGNVSADGGSASQTFTITNSGFGTLTINDADVTFSGTDAVLFSKTGSFPMNLTNGQSGNFNVIFAPTTTGAKTGSLDIQDNLSKVLHQYALTGTGVFNAPTGLTATLDVNTFQPILSWTAPASPFQLKGDNGTIEKFIKIDGVSSIKNIFAKRFITGYSGNISQIAILTKSDKVSKLNSLTLFGADVNGKIDINKTLVTVKDIMVNKSTEWSFINLPSALKVDKHTIFYVAVQMANGEDVFLGLNKSQTDLNNIVSNDEGNSWNFIGSNLIIRTFMNLDANEKLTSYDISSESKNLPVECLYQLKKDENNSENKIVKKDVIKNVLLPNITTESSSKIVQSYTISRGTASGVYDTYLTGISGTPYTDVSANLGNTYYYVVQAVYTGGTSANSNEVSILAINPNYGSFSTNLYKFSNSTANGNPVPGEKPSFEWYPTTGFIPILATDWTTTGTGDDDGYYQINFPGQYFKFFNTDYSSVYVGSNGYITFGAGSTAYTPSGALPNASDPLNMIAAAYRDMYVRRTYTPASNVSYKINADNIIISFENIYAYSAASGTGYISFQITLFTSTVSPTLNSLFIINYNDDMSAAPLATNTIVTSASVGVNNGDGTAGYNYRYVGSKGPLFNGVGKSIGAMALGMTDFNSGTLPAELNAFNSTVNGRDVNLKWITSTESNNSGFEIQRSLLNINYWVKVGFIKGIGTSNSPNIYNFSDTKLNSGKYNYRLKQIDNNGNFHYYSLNNIVEIALPKNFNLSQNYPNPFNPVTKIDYDLPFDSRVRLAIYDMLGREVKVLLNGDTKQAGYYTVELNASYLASGTYFYRFIANSNGKDNLFTKKMVVIK